MSAPLMGRSSKQKAFILVLILTSLWLLFQMDTPGQQSYRLLRRFHVTEDRIEGGWLVNSPACRIQNLDPFDKSILPFLFTDEAPDCSRFFQYGRLVRADSEALYTEEELLRERGLERVECSYAEFWREEEPLGVNCTPLVDNKYRYSNKWKKIENRTQIENEEFVHVKCEMDNLTIFTDFFSFPSRKKATMREPKLNEVSVLLLGVDSVSRLHLHRQMPMTVQFLKTKPLSFEMLGYNKVGSNTFANLAVVLSGLREPELVNKCMKTSVSDDCPLIWAKYKKAGFFTAFAEDNIKSALFQYYNYGFRKQPTDYYGHVFHLVSEKNIANMWQLSTDLCLGNRKQVEVLLEEAKNFAVRLKDSLTMGLFWSSSLTHGRLDLARFGDYDYLKLMETLESNGIFNRTVLIFLSDHGFRWGEIRETYQGYLEERLPFLYFNFPEWFKTKFPLAIRNFEANTRRLTTPFDLHETLLDLIDSGRLSDTMLERWAEKQNYTRGISLFMPIPENRSCEDAKVPRVWCTCHTSEPINANEPGIKELSSFALSHINQILSDYPQCSKLKLQKIHSARRYDMKLDRHESKDNLRGSILRDYTLIIETVPGNAIFETLVRHAEGTDFQESTVIDPVSRLNTYQNQSNCISNHKMKLYCFCLS